MLNETPGLPLVFVGISVLRRGPPAIRVSGISACQYRRLFAWSDAVELRAPILGEPAPPLFLAGRRYDVTPEELEKLFGVLDKAVKKCCKKCGIQEPKRAYWAKMN